MPQAVTGSPPTSPTVSNAAATPQAATVPPASKATDSADPLRFRQRLPFTRIGGDVC